MNKSDRSVLRNLEHLSNALQAGRDNFPTGPFQDTIDAIAEDCKEAFHQLTKAVEDAREDEARNHLASVFFRTSINNLYDDLNWVRGSLQNEWFHLRPSEIRTLGEDEMDRRHDALETLFEGFYARVKRTNPIAAREVFRDIVQRLNQSKDVNKDLLSDVQRSLEACDAAYEEYIQEGINDQPILDAQSLARQRANAVLAGSRQVVDGLLTLISSNYSLSDFLKTFKRRKPTPQTPTTPPPSSEPLQPIPEPPSQDQE